jgi:transposase InsO family protein
MSNNVSSSPVTKLLLNDSNWHVWKPLMRLTLMERGVWGHLDNSDPKPAPPLDGAAMSTELRKWNREENKAIAEILNGCEPGLRGKLMVDTATSTSAGLWKKLETSFKDPGIGVMLTIRFGILTRFCPDEGSVREHADLMVSENNKLIGSGLEFDDLTLAAQLLLTLPKSMQAIRQTFLTRPREQLTFENVKAALLAVDHTDKLAGLIRGESAATTTESSAMYNNGPFTSPRDQPKRPINGKWCDYHRSASHSNADCRQQQPSNNSNTPSGKANMAPHKSGKPKGHAKPNSANASSKVESESDDEEAMIVTLDSEIEPSALTATSNPALQTGQDTTVWMVDSAATLHFCRNNDDMVDYTPTTKLFVKVGDGRRLQIAGIGKIRALLQHKDSPPTTVTLHNVHHVPQLAVNLLSVPCMDELGLTVVIGDGKCVIHNRQQRVIAEAHKDETRHYRLITRPRNTTSSANPTSQAADSKPSGSTRAAQPDTMRLWHNRLGHSSADSVRLLFGNKLVTGVDCEAISTSLRESATTGPLECDSCTIGKAARKPFKPSTIKSKRPLQLIHTDLTGPFNKAGAHSGGRYVLVVVDDYSRFVWVRVLNTKDSSTVLTVLQEYKAWAEARQHTHGHRLLAIRCDGGGEFHSTASLEWYAEHGIEVQTTAPHTSQTNGVAERMHRTIMDKVRTVLSSASMPAAFWPEAVKYVAHTINRLPSRSLGNTTPFELWTGQKPDISHLRPFGCVAFRHIPAQDRHKLSDRSRECAMIGYTGNKQAYILWDPVAQRAVVSRDIQFREHRSWPGAGRGGPTGISTDMFDTNETSRTSPDSLDIPFNSDSTDGEDDDDDDEAGAGGQHFDSEPDHEPVSHMFGSQPPQQSAPPHPRQSRAQAELRDHLPSGPHDSPSVVQNSRLRPFPWHRDRGATWASNGSSNPGAHFTSTSDEAIKWRDSRQAEMDSLLKAGTYSLVPRPAGANVVGCKWVDKEKLLPNGSTKLKSRLVAQGFTQRPGVDFYETHSPTVRLDSLRGLLALAAHYDWDILANNPYRCAVDESEARLYALQWDKRVKRPLGSPSTAPSRRADLLP